MKRKMCVAGSFYPEHADEIKQFFEHCNTRFEALSHELHNAAPNEIAKAIIVPHAGYIYSGFTANVAYSEFAKNPFSNLLVIGPSHRAPLYGMSLCENSLYETPLGDIPLSQMLFNNLKTIFSLSQKIAHAEHSTEVQFPFIKHYFPAASIVEIIYGQIESQEIEKILEYALSVPNTGVIISSDLSHFYTREEAITIDAKCIRAIETLNTSVLNEGCEACGLTGIEAMLASAQRLKLKAQVLDYRTSADTSGDNTRVVGYVSAIFK